MIRSLVLVLATLLLLAPETARAGDAPRPRPYLDVRIELAASGAASARMVLTMSDEMFASLARGGADATMMAQRWAPGATGRFDRRLRALVATVRIPQALRRTGEGALVFAVGPEMRNDKIARNGQGRIVASFRLRDGTGTERGRTVVILPPRTQGAQFAGEIRGVLFRMPLQAGLEQPQTAAQGVGRLRQQAPRRNLVVNGVRMTGRQLALVQQLEARYGARLRDGAYWYDRVSGLIGVRGGPHFAQIAPGLYLGGPLRADASGGLTNVIVNGRALHPLEVRALQRAFGRVVPGRWWVAANGTFGLEGGPALGNLFRAGGGGHRRNGSLLAGTGFLSGGFVNSAGAVFKDGKSWTRGWGASGSNCRIRIPFSRRLRRLSSHAADELPQASSGLSSHVPLPRIRGPLPLNLETGTRHQVLPDGVPDTGCQSTGTPPPSCGAVAPPRRSRCPWSPDPSEAACQRTLQAAAAERAGRVIRSDAN